MKLNDFCFFVIFYLCGFSDMSNIPSGNKTGLNQKRPQIANPKPR